MNFQHYVTLHALYRVLESKKVAFGALAVSYLFIFSFNVAGIIFQVLLAIAIPFTFYLLLVLYKYEKSDWITGFLAWMALSFIPLFLISNDNPFLIAFKITPLLFLVLYCIVLKEKVGEWLLEMEFEKDITTKD